MECSKCGRPSYSDPCFICKTAQKDQNKKQVRHKCSVEGCNEPANITPYAHHPSHILPELRDKNRYCVDHYYDMADAEKVYYFQQYGSPNDKQKFYESLNRVKIDPVITSDTDIIEVF